AVLPAAGRALFTRTIQALLFARWRVDNPGRRGGGMGRPWWYASGVGCLMLSGLSSAAGAGDAQATALVRDALEVDFLATEFAKVEDKLRQAEAVCKKTGCSPAVSAQVHGYLAVLEGSAHKNKAKAIEEFRQMLRIDFTSTLDKRYANANLRDAFDIAQED